MKIIINSEWQELPIVRGSVQPIGYIEIESGATTPTENGVGIVIEPNKMLYVSSADKVWVRAIGKKPVVCHFGGF